jgi:hypothetical protein
MKLQNTPKIIKCSTIIVIVYLLLLITYCCLNYISFYEIKWFIFFDTFLFFLTENLEFELITRYQSFILFFTGK